MNNENEIIKFIKRFNKFGKDITDCFTDRNCYYFYEILKSKFETAEAYYDNTNDHVVTKINGKLYDINGVYKFNSNIIKYNTLNSTIKKQLE